VLFRLSDIVSLSLLIEEKKAKTGVFADFNHKGKVTGYKFYKIDKPLPEELLMAFENEIKNILNNPIFWEKQGSSNILLIDKYNELLKSYLKGFGVALKQKFISMPGYKYNKKTGVFVKISVEEKAKQQFF